MSILVSTSVGRIRKFRCAALLIGVLVVASCTGRDSGPGPLAADSPAPLPVLNLRVRNSGLQKMTPLGSWDGLSGENELARP